MKQYTLIKLSSPGWEKSFQTRSQARDLLYQHICNQCRTEEGITSNSKIEDMLDTACGCEYSFEDTD